MHSDFEKLKYFWKSKLTNSPKGSRKYLLIRMLTVTEKPKYWLMDSEIYWLILKQMAIGKPIYF